jgi:vacuolar-type H+-ATPase subunit E/Vma4
MKALGSPAAVVAAIREEADAEVERLLRESRAAIARLDEDLAREPVVIPERESRLSSARREARARLAQEDMLDAREALEARELWLGRVREEGWRLLDEPAPIADRRAHLAALVVECLPRLPGPAIEVVVGPADACVVDEAWARALASDRAVSIVAREGVAPGGCLVQTADGKVTFDDTRETRAKRFDGAIRAALGAIYKDADAAEGPADIDGARPSATRSGR